jgi:hypothetical protein
LAVATIDVNARLFAISLALRDIAVGIIALSS